jgi:hypothetical protein
MLGNGGLAERESARTIKIAPCFAGFYGCPYPTPSHTRVSGADAHGDGEWSHIIAVEGLEGQDRTVPIRPPSSEINEELRSRLCSLLTRRTITEPPTSNG